MSAVEIVLREVTDVDVGVFYEHQRDAEATEMAGFPARNRDDHEQHWARIRGNPDIITRTVVSRGDVVGNIVSWVQTVSERSATGSTARTGVVGLPPERLRCSWPKAK